VKIIINCDDLGMSKPVNDAILELMKERRVTSATLMMNGGAIEDAAGRLGQFRHCSFGIHLNATEFAPLSAHPGLGPLLNGKGEFAGNLRSVPFTAAIRDGVLAEWSAQVERALALGVPISHLDSHHHIHTEPRLFRVLKRVQQRFSIRRVRVTRNIFGVHESIPMRLRASKGAWNFALRHYVPTMTTRGFGAFATFYERAEAGIGREGSMELMAHPGGEGFAAETALLWGDWKRQFANSAELISYNEL
jgi:chitin disaccharide deacetylase